MNVKHRLIRLIQEHGAQAILRRDLIRAFDISRRADAEKELSSLISVGYVNALGLGHRGSPARVIISPTWPFNICPLCGQNTIHIEAQNGKL